jgi:hypothetical protein
LVGIERTTTDWRWKDDKGFCVARPSSEWPAS